MSKGGAGKVYFVLYLAVILELLIIFIERDEAEEHLRKEQRQAIEIVETILSQLQTGSGTTGITVNPKDNMVLDEKNPVNNVRNYDVVVSVGDPKATITVNGKTLKGDDVPKLEYILSYLPNPNAKEDELGEDTTDIKGGEVKFRAELGTDVGSYAQPHQTFGAVIPAAETNHYFYLNDTLTAKQLASGRRAKVFSVNFKPVLGAGWYRLRFNSQTNKIMGIAGNQPNLNDTVRIGNVKLTVKQLQAVSKALEKSASKDSSKATVARYIHTLITPDAYLTLPENKGFQSFNVHVTKPDIPPPAEPVAQLIAPDTTYWYTLAPFTVQVKLGPEAGRREVQGAALKEIDKANGLYAATYDVKTEGQIPMVARATNEAGKTQTSEKLLSAETPALKTGIEKWRGMRATVSRKYNPTSEWASTKIPANNYQTIVEINGKEVFNRAGVSFKDAELPPEMLVTEGTKDIKTTVYWKPGGISDRTQWKLLLSNQKGAGAFIEPTKPFAINYLPPEHVDGFQFDWAISPKKMSAELGPIVLRQTIGEKQSIPVTQADAACTECAEAGLSARLQPSGDDWVLLMNVADRSKLKPSIIGKRFTVDINMTGRGGAVGTGSVEVTIKAGK